MSWELNNTSRGFRLAFHEQGPFIELEFYQCVAKCCSSYIHPPKFFLSLFWSLPTNPTQHFVKYSSFKCFPRTKEAFRSQLIHSPRCFSPRLDPTVGWETSPWKLLISRGQLAFPPAITQSYLTACWAPRLHNPASQPSQQDLHKFSQQQAVQLRICTNLGSSQLLYPEIAQISSVARPAPSQKCTFFFSNQAVSCMWSWVDYFPLGLRKIDLHAWVASPKAACKDIPCFRELFLAVGGYMQGSIPKPPTKCRFP